MNDYILFGLGWLFTAYAVIDQVRRKHKVWITLTAGFSLAYLISGFIHVSSEHEEKIIEKQGKFETDSINVALRGDVQALDNQVREWKARDSSRQVQSVNNGSIAIKMENNGGGQINGNDFRGITIQQ